MTVDEYLAGAPEPQHSTLDALRATLRDVIPEAVEGMSYGVPGFLVDGRPVAGYAFAKKHCSYFPHSGAVLESLAEHLTGYDWSKGTLRFAIGEPLPRDLVELLVKAKLAL